MPRNDLTDQPTAAPTRKVTASGVWGGVVVLVLIVAHGLGVEVPGVDYDALGIAVPGILTGLGAMIGGYLTRDRA